MISRTDRHWRIDNASRLKGPPLAAAPIRSPERELGSSSSRGLLAKFAEIEGIDIQQEGYTTGDDYPHGACYEWICRACFSDLR
jgi:hypothetical protein